MSLASEIAAYIATVDAAVTTQSTVNSIGPVAVGEVGTALATLLLPYMEEINDFGITASNIAPDDLDGSDKDLHFQGGAEIKIWRKIVSTWDLQATIPLGITFPEGPLTLRTSLSGMVVTITPGAWSIDNTIYSKGTQTQVTLDAADLNFGRIDLIYANTSGTIGLVTGTASATPANPTLPADSIAVDYAIVPASSSGNSPYMLYGSVVDASSGVVTYTNATTSPLSNTTLDGLYTAAGLGAEVLCENITDGPRIYKKMPSGAWHIIMTQFNDAV